MDAHFHDDADALAERTTRLIAHLDGALSPSMLDAMSGVWSTLERAAADDSAHARAVRARLFWESLTPGSHVVAPSTGVFRGRHQRRSKSPPSTIGRRMS